MDERIYFDAQKLSRISKKSSMTVYILKQTTTMSFYDPSTDDKIETQHCNHAGHGTI